MTAMITMMIAMVTMIVTIRSSALVFLKSPTVTETKVIVMKAAAVVRMIATKKTMVTVTDGTDR